MSKSGGWLSVGRGDGKNSGRFPARLPMSQLGLKGQGGWYRGAGGTPANRVGKTFPLPWFGSGLGEGMPLNCSVQRFDPNTVACGTGPPGGIAGAVSAVRPGGGTKLKLHVRPGDR